MKLVKWLGQTRGKVKLYGFVALSFHFKGSKLKEKCPTGWLAFVGPQSNIQNK